MKTLSAITLLAVFILTGCSFVRIGNLTMASTRNVDTKTEYKILQKGVEGKAKVKKDNALQEAIENAVKKLPDGEFMKNVTVYMKSNGKVMKVVGDVWGVPSVQKDVTIKVEEEIVFKVGDKVAFRKTKTGKLKEGTIIGINSNGAIVEYLDTFNNPAKSEVKFEMMTKVQ